MKFNINGRFGIEFLDLDANERGIKTIKHRAVGIVEADNEALAKIEARQQIYNFIDTNYPCRWNSGIYDLEINPAEFGNGVSSDERVGVHPV